MARCSDCANLNLKTYPSQAAVGFGRCNLETLPGVFESIVKERECKDYRPIVKNDSDHLAGGNNQLIPDLST